MLPQAAKENNNAKKKIKQIRISPQTILTCIKTNKTRFNLYRQKVYIITHTDFPATKQCHFIYINSQRVYIYLITTNRY